MHLLTMCGLSLWGLSQVTEKALHSQLAALTKAYRGKDSEVVKETCRTSKGRACTTTAERNTYKADLEAKYRHGSVATDTKIEFIMGDKPTFVDVAKAEKGVDPKWFDCTYTNGEAIKDKYTQNPLKQVNVIICNVQSATGGLSLGTPRQKRRPNFPSSPLSL